MEIEQKGFEIFIEANPDRYSPFRYQYSVVKGDDLMETGEATSKEGAIAEATQIANDLNYVDKLDLPLALWWFIENINDGNESRNALFFYLRERVRNGN